MSHHAHHRQHWAHGGPTDLTNLANRQYILGSVDAHPQRLNRVLPPDRGTLRPLAMSTTRPTSGSARAGQGPAAGTPGWEEAAPVVVQWFLPGREPDAEAG